MIDDKDNSEDVWQHIPRTTKISGSMSPEPLLILFKGTKNLSLNRGDKKKQGNKYKPKANANVPKVRSF